MSVIFSRAPLRISLGGGGTDLPSYYREHGGFLVAGAIDKYVYMLIAHGLPAPLPDEVLGDRGGRRRSRRSGIRSCARALLRHWRGNPLEIASVADVPAGTGMGSSGRVHGRAAQGAGARAADLDHAGRAGRGGVRDRDRRARGAVRQAGPVRRRARRHLRLHVQPRRHASTSSRSSCRPRRCAACASSCCCSTPARRASASAVLVRPGRADQERRRRRCSRTCTGPRRWAARAASCCVAGDLFAYAELMHEHWENKRRRSPGMANEPDRRALHARPPQRRDRRQARRRRRRRLPARLRAQPGRHASGDGGGGRARAAVRLRVRRGVMPPSTHERAGRTAGRRSSAAG